MFSHAALNAFLNGTSGMLLACGYTAIRKGKVQIHKRFMISAFAVSTVFLFSYLLYHYRVGHVPFHGQGWIRPVYFVLLTSHTILAIVIVPMILITLAAPCSSASTSTASSRAGRCHYGFMFALRV